MSQNPPPVQIVLTAKDETKVAIDSAVRGLNQLKASATGLTGIVAGLTAAVAGLAVVQQFRQFVAAAAAMDDLAEKTGASVEKLSALAGVAKISGVSIDVVESSLIRLAKGLAGADEESKGAGNALAALGLKAEDLKNLDTADALKLVADQLNKYKDGAGKTALAIDLLGKSGAQALPYLKDLAETEKLVGRLTTEQAAQAENLEKNLVRLAASTSGAWKEFSASVLPTVDAFVQALLEATNKSGGLRDEIKRLTADGTIEGWAQTAAIGLANIVDVFRALIGVIPVATSEFSVFRKEAEILGNALLKGKRAPIVQDTIMARLNRERDELRAMADAIAKKFADTPLLADQLRARFSPGAVEEFADLRGQNNKPKLKYTSRVEKTGAAKDELAGIVSYVQGIREQVIGATDGEFEKMRQKARDVFGNVNFEGLSSANKKRFQEGFKEVEAGINLLDERARSMQWAKTLAEGFTLAGQAAEAANAALAGFNQSLSQQAQDMQFEIAMVGKLSSERQKLASIRRIDLEAQRAVAAVPGNAQNRDETIDKINSVAEAAKKQVSDLNDTLRTVSREGFGGLTLASREYFDRITDDARNWGEAFTSIMGGVEGVFVDFVKTGKLNFRSLAESILGDLARIAARQSITGPIAKAFGNAFGTGGPEQLSGPGAGGGGLLDNIAGFFGFRAGGGPVMAGGAYVVGERGPELFVPDIAGSVVANGAGGGTVNHITIPIDARGAELGVETRIQQAVKQAVQLSLSAVQAQANRGGSYARDLGRR